MLIHLPLDFLSLVSTDEALGRLDYASLSEQSRMEILVDMANGKSDFQDDAQNYTDFEAWGGVTTHADGTVQEIDWLAVFAGGTLRLDFLPASLERIDISMNDLLGTISTALLPRGLMHLDAYNNQLSDEFSIAGLPLQIETIDLTTNKLSGSLDLTVFPSGITCFGAMHNLFCGSIDLSKLPDSLEQLCLRDNLLSGTINLLHVPISIKQIDLGKNAIEQKMLLIGKLPVGLFCIDLRQNRIGRVDYTDPEKGVDPRVRFIH